MASPTEAKAPTFNITITADTTCAWCYINHVRLHKAIHLYSKTYCSSDTFSIHYLPFLLHPDLPTESVPIQEKFHERFGSTRAQTISKLMTRTGLADGINFSNKGRVGDSRASHQVIALVGRERGLDSQDRVVGEIMKRYYEDDADITDAEMLMACAVEMGGVGRPVIEECLENDRMRPFVNQQAMLAREKGINSVPHMAVNGIVVDGARDVEELLEFLVTIKKARVDS